MKKTVLLLASLFVMTLATQQMMAQNSASATAKATATIIAPISIEKNVDLQFGKIVKSTTLDGTVSINASDQMTPSYTNVAAFSGADKKATTAAKFTVSGEKNYMYTITIPTSDISITSGTNNMKVSSFSSNLNGTGTITATGTQTLYVGATLTVKADQAAGDYTGSFDVTVAYN